MTNGRCYPTSLIKSIMQYTKFPDVPALKWGRENEDRVCQEYTRNVASALVVTTSGLVINPKYLLLGASPDGIVNCECYGHGVLEMTNAPTSIATNC